jgi:hypothetical protein
MFLFTSLPNQPETKAASQSNSAGGGTVVDAIRDGSARSGADFDYLLKTAQRESSLDPGAKAKSSSATGLFQFIEQTWLGMVKGAGPEHGLGDYAQAISASNGRYDVADPALKQEILQLRNDPKTASVMAGEFTRRNAQVLSNTLGRQASDGELYIAHFMGAGGAADLIRQSQSNPGGNAAELFPDQASSNRAIFFDKASGRAKTVSEVYTSLVSGAAGAAVPNVPKLSSDPSSWLVGQAGAATTSTVTAYAHADGPAMYGLFRTEGQRGPMNAAVQQLWSGMPARAVEEDRTRYFPRSSDRQGRAANGSTSTASSTNAPGTAAASAAPVPPGSVPLPRPRPADLRTGTSGSAIPGTAIPDTANLGTSNLGTANLGGMPAPDPRRPPAVSSTARSGRASTPLDLLAFRKKDAG